MRQGRIGLAAIGCAVVLVLAGQGAAPAAADNYGMALVLDSLAPMLPGQRGWVSALWEAEHDVCNVRLTASGPGLTIRYPTNTGTFSSLYTSNGLAKTNIDYTALDITVAPTVTAPVTVTLSVSWQALPPNVINKNDDLVTKKFACTGTAGTQVFTATLPVSPASGAAVVQKTSAAAVPRGTPAWVTITFRGTRPGLSNFHVTLTPRTGLAVSYPGGATSAGLNGGSTLPVGADDFVAVRLDASGLSPGVYQIPIVATYTGGTFSGQLALTVT